MDTKALQDKLDKGFIAPDQLYWSVKLLNNSLKETPAFKDVRYLPFYYYLGQFVSPVRAIQMGCDDGLVSVAFLKSCLSVKEWHFIEPVNSVSVRNANQFCGRVLLSSPLKNADFDIGFLPVRENELFLDRLELMWQELKPQGLLVIDYINVDSNKQKFHEFARVKNREAIIFDTRYGVGILER